MYIFDSTVLNTPPITMFWNSFVTITNFTVSGPSGSGIFYIQYNSKIILKNFTVSKFTCSNLEKGWIFSVISGSILLISTVSITNINTFSSLIHVDNSTLNGTNFYFESIFISGQSDTYVITSDLAHISISFLKLSNFFGGFLYSDQSYLELLNLSIANNIYKFGSLVSEISVFLLNKNWVFSLANSNFSNILTMTDGGVILKYSLNLNNFLVDFNEFGSF